jgi:hypothetical protein
MLKYEVKMFVASPLLPPISKRRGLHRNEVNASACGKITNGDLVQLLLCNRSRGVDRVHNTVAWSWHFYISQYCAFNGLRFLHFCIMFWRWFRNIAKWSTIARSRTYVTKRFRRTCFYHSIIHRGVSWHELLEGFITIINFETRSLKCLNFHLKKISPSFHRPCQWNVWVLNNPPRLPIDTTTNIGGTEPKLLLLRPP